MQTSPKIEFFKEREFGDKINITFAFIRQNAGSYLKYQLFISGPFIAVGVILTALFMSSFFGIITSAGANGVADPSAVLGSMGNLFLTMLIYMMIYLVVSLVGLGYMRAYHESPDGKVDMSDITRRFWKKLPAGLGAVLLGLVCISIGYLFLIIPGIYLAIAFSLILVIIMFEDDSNSVSVIGRSIKLTGGKWWSTFGLLFVTSIIAAAIGYVIQLPVALISFSQEFTSASESGVVDPEGFGTTFGVVYSLFYYIALLINVFIVQTALAFQYFNLVEKKESRGLMDKIEGMGASTEEQNEEHY